MAQQRTVICLFPRFQKEALRPVIVPDIVEEIGKTHLVDGRAAHLYGFLIVCNRVVIQLKRFRCKCKVFKQIQLNDPHVAGTPEMFYRRIIKEASPVKKGFSKNVMNFSLVGNLRQEEDPLKVLDAPDEILVPLLFRDFFHRQIEPTESAQSECRLVYRRLGQPDRRLRNEGIILAVIPEGNKINGTFRFCERQNGRTRAKKKDPSGNGSRGDDRGNYNDRKSAASSTSCRGES